MSLQMDYEELNQILNLGNITKDSKQRLMDKNNSSDITEIKNKTTKLNRENNNLIQYGNKAKNQSNSIPIHKQPSGIEEIYYSYKKRFENVMKLIDMRSSFRNRHNNQEEKSSTQLEDYSQQNNYFQVNSSKEANRFQNIATKEQQSLINIQEYQSQTRRKSEILQNLIAQKDSFEQNVLGKLKEYYRNFLVICKEDQEITEKEQRILKKYFSIMADVQALKVIVVTLTNQILNENLQIYTSLLQNKQDTEAQEFLQRQVQFRKKLQEMIADKNCRITSVILYLVNFSRSAFYLQKEALEKIFQEKLQFYQQIECQIQMQQKQQQQCQILPSISSSLSQTILSTLKQQNSFSDKDDTLSRRSDSFSIIDINDNNSQRKNIVVANKFSINQLSQSIDQIGSEFRQPSPLSQLNLNKRPSIFKKVQKQNQNNQNLDEFNSFINNTQIISKSDNLDNYRQVAFPQNQILSNQIEAQLEQLKYFRSNSFFSQDDGQITKQNQASETRDNKIQEEKKESLLVQNCSYSSSPIGRVQHQIVLSKLNQQSQLFNPITCLTNPSSVNEISSPLFKKTTHRNSLPCQDIPNGQNGSNEQICSKMINSQSSEQFNNSLQQTSQQIQQPLIDQQAIPILKYYPSCPQKDTQKSTYLYNANSPNQQIQGFIQNTSKSEYYQYLPQQIKKSDLINNKELKRLPFIVSNQYKRKWIIQEKSNLEDYSQIDEQYHHLACNNAINSIDSPVDKKIFLEKMYTNLMKINSQIQYSIKTFIQSNHLKLKQKQKIQTCSTPSTASSNVSKSNTNKFNNSQEDVQTASNINNNKNNNKLQLQYNITNNNCYQNNNSLKSFYNKQAKNMNNSQLLQNIPNSSSAKNLSTNNNTTQDSNNLNSPLLKGLKIPIKFANIAVVTTPNGNMNNSQNPLSQNNCLSLINQNSVPFFSKTLRQKVNEEISLKKEQNQNKQDNYGQKLQTPIGSKEEQATDNISIDSQLNQFKLNSTFLSNIYQGNIQKEQINEQNSSQTLPISRHRSLKDKLTKDKALDKSTATKLQNEEIQLYPLIFKQNLINKEQLSQIKDNSTNEYPQQNQTSHKNLFQCQIFPEAQKVYCSVQNSLTQNVQFILLQSQTPKLSQMQKEKNQISKFQQNFFLSSPQKYNSCSKINSTQSLHKNNNGQDLSIISQQIINQNNKFDLGPPQKIKNAPLNSNYLTGRYASLNQYQKLNNKNSFNFSDFKQAPSQYAQVQTQEDSFKDYSLKLTQKNIKAQSHQKKKNQIYTPK